MTVSSTTRRRLGAAFAAFVIAASAIALGADPVAAADFTVRQGDTVRLISTERGWVVPAGYNPPGGINPFSVDPIGAGTVSFPAGPNFPAPFPTGSGAVIFAASGTFLGTATVCSGSYCVDVDVVPSGQASGSFVPVAAPGPCLLITANPVVDFGNVTLGSDYTTAAAPPQIAGCAPSGVTQDIAIRATNAQNGLTSLNVDDSCPVVPVNPPANPLEVCDPAVGTYSVAVPSTTQSTTQTDRNLLVRSGSSVLLEDQAGSFATTLVDLAVKLPSELAPTFVGTIFTFDVVFTAIPA